MSGVLSEIAAHSMRLIEADDELWVDELDAMLCWSKNPVGERPLFACLFEHYGRWPRHEEAARILGPLLGAGV